jgi:predicted nucleotidyltransferase
VDEIKYIIERIKKSLAVTAPGAETILYGSYARGDYHAESDIDLLILMDKENVSREEEKKIIYPLYDIEFETGKVISPIIKTKKDWITKYPSTPFYQNVTTDGISI